MSQPALKPQFDFGLDAFEAFIDERPGERWELVDGVPRAMVWTTFAHAVVSRNVVNALTEPARRRGCQALGGFMAAIGDNTAFEPDAIVFCGPIGQMERRTHTPAVVFEVLSPSTMHYDRSLKASRHRSLPSLQQLVLVYQDSVRVESWLRRDEGWTEEPDVLLSRADSLAVPCIGTSLPLDAVYADLAFEPGER